MQAGPFNAVHFKRILFTSNVHHAQTRVFIIAHLPHVAQCIAGFLDNTHKWNLESASKAGLPVLLDRLAASEWSGLSNNFRKTRFLRKVEIAAKLGHALVAHLVSAGRPRSGGHHPADRCATQAGVFSPRGGLLLALAPVPCEDQDPPGGSDWSWGFGLPPVGQSAWIPAQ